MNVIVLNERKELNNLNIDIIKSVDGVYTVDELVGMFTNFFFNRMILDITSIKEYTDYTVLKKIFETIDARKIILVLNEASSSKEYISDLITLGVYNFTSNSEEVLDLFNNPKTFDDVASLQITKSTYDINSEIDAQLGVNKEENKKEKKEGFVQESVSSNEYMDGKKVIGVINLTDHAGATTLVVQMVKQLNIEYKAIGIEMNKQDFLFFKTPNLYTCTSTPDALRKIKEHKDVDAVIVDLNTYDAKDFCTDVIYLLEPGVLRLTKLIRKNEKIFEELSGQKLILNRTNMDDGMVREFEVETKSKIFCVVSNFRDNLDRVISVDKLLFKLGYTKCNKEEPKKGLFGK